MLNGFIFIPPIIAAFLLAKKPNFIVIASLLIIITVIFLRFPQLYGKNFKVYPDSIYQFNQLNVHSDLMNTVWADYPQNYPKKTTQFLIIGGKGSIEKKTIKNSSREYLINATTPMKMIDNTFYFPGWKAYIDGKEAPIQFQDANYRGLIEYDVPQGEHSVFLVFKDSWVRLLGKAVTLFSILLLTVLFIYRKRLKVVLNKL
jgi:hypothetical protein